MKFCAFSLIALLCGCAGQYVPPVSISGGFFGASVTVSEPGFTVPAKVVSTAAVKQPTLMVSPSDPLAASDSTTVTTSIGSSATVPVMVAPVSAPVVAVPSK